MVAASLGALVTFLFALFLLFLVFLLLVLLFLLALFFRRRRRRRLARGALFLGCLFVPVLLVRYRSRRRPRRRDTTMLVLPFVIALFSAMMLSLVFSRLCIADPIQIGVCRLTGRARLVEELVIRVSFSLASSLRVRVVFAIR